MHRDLRKHLRNARGESEFVLAANVDIRGFSSFFSDSSQAAAFLSRAYTTILDKHFTDVDFFKPTGDGLLIVYRIDEDRLAPVVNAAVRAALELDADFASICDGFDLINFETPRHVGIGLARGTATKISAGRKTLDYSGFPLNLASRLMDLARPHGVVFDASMTLSLLEPATAEKFSPANAYLRGIAEVVPRSVMVSTGVQIPESNRSPIGASQYSQQLPPVTLRDLQQRTDKFIYDLELEPLDLDSVVLTADYPFALGNRQHPEIQNTDDFTADFVSRDGDKFGATFDLRKICAQLLENGTKPSWQVELRLRYPVRLSTLENKRAQDVVDSDDLQAADLPHID